jgi:hypothetical protein
MVGQTIDRYTLVEKLGSGGMGDVFKAHHVSLDQYRAVKVLPPHLSRNPELVERFMREARRCAALQHPNIVRLEHVGEQEGLHYLVMDYVPGRSLRQVVDDDGPLAVGRALHYAAQVCRALEHAHENGVLHRDVKPSNILIDRDGRAVLTDFGIARGMDGDEPGLTAAGETVGTPEYMSPEQVRGEPLDARSDVYSLGVVLYEMLTGELPFAARSKNAVKRLQLEREPDPPRLFRAEIPPAVEALVLRALEKDPAHRFASAAEMADALAGVGEREEALAGRKRGELVTSASTTALGWTGAPVAGTLLRDRPSGPNGNGHRDQDQPTTFVTPGPRREDPRAFPPVLQEVVERFRDPRVRPLLIAAGALSVLVLAALLLQRLGSGPGDRFTAQKAVDPRTNQEYGVVTAHGAPAFVITRPYGDLTAVQRAERASQRLQEMIAGRDGEALEPEMVAAVVNGRGETVIARRQQGAAGTDIDPEDVIVTVDASTAKSYSPKDSAALALWWRDVLRDQVRLAQGKPPVATHDTRYGRILDQVYQEVEDEKKGDWVPAAEIRKAFDNLPDSHRTVVDTAWRTVPTTWRGARTETEPVRVGLKPVPRENVTACDSEAGYSARRAIDNDMNTAWQSLHGAGRRGRYHWLKVHVPRDSPVSELEIREGRRSNRPEYQLRIKQARAVFSDGSTHRLWRAAPGDPLRASFPARETDWVKIEFEQFFRHPAPYDSHVYVSEVRLWGS